MKIVTILGGNQGDRREILREAVRLLSADAGKVISASSLYETEPWGFSAGQNFLNQVVVFETPLDPHTFLHRCLETERRLGRQRHKDGPRYSSRPIDIDLLFCGNEIIDTDELQIPHPRLCQRNFVLTPLAEILPEFIHPVVQKSISRLKEECPDRLDVHLYTPEK